MKESIRLGRIAGVPVGINWSLVVIFALITVSLAGARLPADHPGLEPAVYLAAGLVTALLFFASILAHEVGHAVVARRNGIGVHGITLWLFGGVAKLDGEARDPGAELRIAGIGPLISLAVAAAAWGAAALLDALGAHGIAVAAAGWLAVINLILAAFNLVPAAPLDGGRVLRALLWWRRGDAAGAAITAARAGRAFGFGLIALGLIEFAGGAGFGGLWLAFIGWFLINAARAEEGAASVRASVADLHVRDVMTPDPVIVPPDATVEQLIDGYVWRHRFSSFPVGRDHRSVEGLVTMRAVKAVPADRRRMTQVRDLAVPAAEVSVGADDDLAGVLPRLAEERRALVIDGEGVVVGILSPTDVVRVIELGELRDRAPRGGGSRDGAAGSDAPLRVHHDQVV